MVDLKNERKGFVSNYDETLIRQFKYEGKYPFNDLNGEITDGINYYSQNGEDGVLEKIFETLNITKGKFINCGSDDIHDHSNVRRLISLKGWEQGLFIEPNSKYLIKGKENLENDKRIIDKTGFKYHNGYVSVNKNEELLPNIIKHYYKNLKTFDLLTLKIDSYEYWVLKSFLESKYNSKIILVGYNSSLKGCVSSPKDCPPKLGHNKISDNFYGASALAIHKLMDAYNFELISICYPNNMIYIDKSLNRDSKDKKIFKPYEKITIDDYYFKMLKGHGTRLSIKKGWEEV